jgi:hypothetical protein
MKITAPNAIRAIRASRHFDVIVDGRQYDVTCRWQVIPNNGRPINWEVRGGGNFRDHLCDPDGATHKRIVAFVVASDKPTLA